MEHVAIIVNNFFLRCYRGPGHPSVDVLPLLCSLMKFTEIICINTSSKSVASSILFLFAAFQANNQLLQVNKEILEQRVKHALLRISKIIHMYLYACKSFHESIISYLLIRKRKCVYYGITNVTFMENDPKMKSVSNISTQNAIKEESLKKTFQIKISFKNYLSYSIRSQCTLSLPPESIRKP